MLWHCWSCEWQTSGRQKSGPFGLFEIIRQDILSDDAEGIEVEVS